jgi:endonuclease/exonuclease/phosphatase family metal-dependent hydrolase
VQITFASYNIHKAVGVDRRRDPERILAVLREIDADVVALQEADRRFGRRLSVLPRDLIEAHTPYHAVAVSQRPDSIGWHGNALLVRRDIEVADAAIVPLPVLEPRGAIRADLVFGKHRVRVVGMHLDLSGLRRRQQVRSVLAHLTACEGECPAVLMGDLNEWALHGGALREFGGDWHVLSPGRSFPSRRPIAQLDRIVVSPQWQVLGAAVHHSALSARGSDHLPVHARLELPKI